MMGHTRYVLLITAIGLYSLLVCILDAIAPLGIEVWVLNVPVILVPVMFRNIRLVLLSCLACSGMVLLGNVFSPPGNNPPLWDNINRGMGLAVMGLIALLGISIIRRSNQLDAALPQAAQWVVESRYRSD
jgi:hypothetical protein